MKPGFTNYQPYQSHSLGPEVKLNGGGTKINESKQHENFKKDNSRLLRISEFF